MGTAGLGDTSPSLLGLSWLLSGRGRSLRPAGAPRPRRSRLAAGAEGAHRESTIKRIFLWKSSGIWSAVVGEQGGGGCALPQWEGERGWALGLPSRPRNYLLQRVTEKPLEDSQRTLLSTRTFPLSKFWEAAQVPISLLTLTALNTIIISGALGPRPAQFPPVPPHSQPAGLGWNLSWWLPEHS